MYIYVYNYICVCIILFLHHILQLGHSLVENNDQVQYMYILQETLVLVLADLQECYNVYMSINPSPSSMI